MLVQAQVQSGSSAVRPFVAFALLALVLYSLLAHWEQRGSSVMDDSDIGNVKLFEVDAPAPAPAPEPLPTPDVQVGNYNPADFPRKVVAHFMLGNTYPFTSDDWYKTLRLAEATELDGLVLNLGRETWQFEQAKTAFQVAEANMEKSEGIPRLQLFLSLDMNVIDSNTIDDAFAVAGGIAPLLSSSAYMHRGGQPILSTFSGHDAYGEFGWQPFLDHLEETVGKKVFFWPAFFTDPHTLFNKTPLADGHFGWNTAWPLEDKVTSLDADQPYLSSGRPYMAAVSPLFFTHYGDTGEWAFHKNWIYRSDDLLYPKRWAQLLALPRSRAPEMVQVVSWNDYGESHNIAPVRGAEPGSQKWTKDMDHIAFREMTAYFARRWRDDAGEARDDEITIWMWYRTHQRHYHLTSDRIDRPKNADWARDLINMLILVPKGLEKPMVEIRNGAGSTVNTRRFALHSGHANGITARFRPGKVSFTLSSSAGVHVTAEGRDISTFDQVETYNFNMWSHVWHLNPDHMYRSEGIVVADEVEPETEVDAEPVQE